MELKRAFDLFLYYIALPLMAINYVLTPITNDGRIYIGVEYIADHFYPYPYGWDLAWEIKPVANRIMAWALYKGATLFVPFENEIVFGIAVKILALAVVTVIAYYFSIVVNRYKPLQTNIYTFPLIWLSMVAIANFIILQAEYWAVVFSLLTIAFLLTDNEHLHYLAGALFVVIGLFKGITCLMFLPILCAVLLLRPSWRLYWVDVAGGFLSAVAMFFVLNATIWPHMLSDMLMSAQVARVGMYPVILYALSTVGLLFVALQYMPLAIVGIIAALLYFIRECGRSATGSMLFAVMWVVPFGIVFMQGEFFYYHYYPLVVPTLVTLILWGRMK
jgi:hypothetical protein